MAPPTHLKNAGDLITGDEATRAGFLLLAIERNRLSTPLVAQARALKVAATNAGTIDQCVKDASMRPALLAAAGVSDKAIKHFTDADKDTAIKDWVENYMAPAGTNYIDEFVFRFLITKGDAIGGEMRNTRGQLAQRKLIRALAAALDIMGVHYFWLGRRNAWHAADSNEPDFEMIAKGLSWTWEGKNRTLLLNKQMLTVRKNIDICLLNCEKEQARLAVKNPEAFLALGELKGGADPAGADEH